MSDYHLYFKLLIFLSLLILNFIIFLFKESLENVSELSLEKDIEENKKGSEQIFKIFQNKKNVLSLAYIVFTFTLYINFFLVPSNIDTLLAIIYKFIISIVYISIGIILPYNLASINFNRYLYLFYKFIKLLLFLFAILNILINYLTKAVLFFIGYKKETEVENVSEEEIINLVNEGKEQGIFESSEAKMISNIFELNDKHASDIMINRKNIIGIDADTSLSAVVDFMLNEGSNSRYPVFSEDIDHIIGFINMKDALVHLRKTNKKNRKIREIKGLIRKIKFVPETKLIDELFEEMQATKQHIVIVIDEYGQTSGLISLEDILEEIVGNILDEYDEEDNNIIKLEKNIYLLKGECSLEEIEDILLIEFDEEEYEEFDTLNGFLISKMGKLPKENEEFSIKYKNLIFISNEVGNNFIKSVKVKILK